MKGLPVKVSLIVPVYNVEGFLAQSIESCCRQTLRDLEIICVDDGSTDQSGKMLEEFKKADHRIKIIHKQNGGLSSARNAGMKAANGEWIMLGCDENDPFALRSTQDVLGLVHSIGFGPVFRSVAPICSGIQGKQSLAIKGESVSIEVHAVNIAVMVERMSYSRNGRQSAEVPSPA